MKEKITILTEQKFDNDYEAMFKEYGKIKQRNKELYAKIRKVREKEELTDEDHQLIMKCFNEIQANIDSLDKFIR